MIIITFPSPTSIVVEEKMCLKNAAVLSEEKKSQKGKFV